MEPHRPTRNDTFDLRYDILSDDQEVHAHADAANYVSDEEHSVLEDDSDGEDNEEYMDEDDDGSSDLSIPNESIDFDLVYSLHSFAATVDGQANVVKGDSLFLMDDSNSYWWLVRVLKTQEVGYIPAENIETPFERLARLNKHRNVDLASPTQAEVQDRHNAPQDQPRNDLSSRSQSRKGVFFNSSRFFHRYPPAIWNEEEPEDDDEEFDLEDYEDYDDEHDLEDVSMEPDESWDDTAVEDTQAQPAPGVIPSALLSGTGADPRKQQAQLYDEQQQQARQQQTQLSGSSELSSPRLSPSHEASVQPKEQPGSVSPSRRLLDPAEAGESKRVTLTPSIASDDQPITPPRRTSPNGPSPLLPSEIISKQEEESRLKRLRTEESDESLANKRGNKGSIASSISTTSSGSTSKAPAPSIAHQRTSSGGSGKLRKDRGSTDEDEPSKKKKNSVFGGLFSRKKDKDKGKDKERNNDMDSIRTSEDSGRRPSQGDNGSSNNNNAVSPVTAAALQQQQSNASRNSTDPKRAVTSPPPTQQTQVASNQLRQHDLQQQALYQQYLDRSPSTSLDIKPSIGLWSAPAVMHGAAAGGGGLGPPTVRPRPNSLILMPGDAQGVGVPDLSVLRVFAGDNLQTEATFKTVLLNSNTSAKELVRQAIQRFRLPAEEKENEYYLTVVKQIEGSSAILRDNECPLGVFEDLVDEANRNDLEVPKVKRSSVGSISSVASNLSMHPAIKKLPMNDFSDDSAVKFYLNRKGDLSDNDERNNSFASEGDETLIAADASMTSEGNSRQFLTVTTGGHNVSPERFSSPSFRFALQLLIYPDDLPDNMVFDPVTEAIVFKDTLRNRLSGSSVSSSVSQTYRKKVFVFPKNVTVAEVIELGLERFGISEGVVDGGDEVEDKLSKRRSIARVRYTLTVDVDGHERELPPSSKVIDAFSKPPTHRIVDTKRRSIDSAQLLNSMEDIGSEDPLFVLRKAAGFRSTNGGRHRMSVPLDEFALANLHRESVSSNGSSEGASKQAIIEAQRRIRRDNQQAILTTQANAQQGVDVLLPGNAMLRSLRYDIDDKMRYSYVEPDGETYDISEIVEEEWKEPGKNDLLEGVLGRSRDGKNMGDALDRVLSKIKSGKATPQLRSDGKQGSMRSISPGSQYSMDEITEAGEHRSVTPGAGGIFDKPPTPTQFVGRKSPPVPERNPSRPGTTTPTGRPGTVTSRRQPSIASVMSDLSGYATAATHPTRANTDSPRSMTGTSTPTQKGPPKHIIVPDDDSIQHMLKVIEYRASISKTKLPELDPVDALLFGRPIDINSLHPRIREIYSPAFKHLEDIDQMLDKYLLSSKVASEPSQT